MFDIQWKFRTQFAWYVPVLWLSLTEAALFYFCSAVIHGLVGCLLLCSIRVLQDVTHHSRERFANGATGNQMFERWC